MPRKSVLPAGPCFLAVLVLMAATTGAPAEHGHLGPQRVLVLGVTFTDTTPRLPKVSDWVNLLGNQVGSYVTTASYGQTSVVFETPSGLGMPAGGWFPFGDKIAKWPGTVAGAEVVMGLAAPFVQYKKYDRVLVVLASGSFGAQTACWRWVKVPRGNGDESTEKRDGEDVPVRRMCVSASNEWVAQFGSNTFDAGAATIAHELGHQWAIPVHYFDVRWSPNQVVDSVTPWDLMGRSPTLNQTVAWGKLDRSWIAEPGPRVINVGPPLSADIDTVVTLDPVNLPSNRLQAVRVPFSLTGTWLNPLFKFPGTFAGYVLEYRRNFPGVESVDTSGALLPEGVLVSLVDEAPEVVLGEKNLVVPNPAFPMQPTKAVLRKFDSYFDAGRNLRITFTDEMNGQAFVRIEYAFPPPGRPDPSIQDWGNPPWETPDIWLDSEKNGFGKYRYTDDAGNPLGQGDDAWLSDDKVTRKNRVYVRIHNAGPGAASNVKVRLEVNDPPGLGDRGSKWNTLGTIVFPLVAGQGTAQDYLNWVTKTGKHTCLRAIIEPYVGELSAANNLGRENVSTFETSPGSPYEPVSLPMHVENPFPADEMPVVFDVQDIPPKWTFEVSPRDAVLSPGGSEDLTLTLSPPDPRKVLGNAPGTIAKPKIAALLPFADTFIPIGGVEMWTHLVRRTVLTCAAVLQPGGKVRVSGRLTWVRRGGAQVPIGGAQVALEQVRLSDPGFRAVIFVTTDAFGRYSIVMARGDTGGPLGPGEYQVQAWFAGDDKNRSASSDPQPFTVN